MFPDSLTSFNILFSLNSVFVLISFFFSPSCSLSICLLSLHYFCLFSFSLLFSILKLSPIGPLSQISPLLYLSIWLLFRCIFSLFLSPPRCPISLVWCLIAFVVRYFTENSDGSFTGDSLYEKWFHCTNLGVQLVPLIKA